MINSLSNDTVNNNIVNINMPLVNDIAVDYLKSMAILDGKNVNTSVMGQENLMMVIMKNFPRLFRRIVSPENLLRLVAETASASEIDEIKDRAFQTLIHNLDKRDLTLNIDGKVLDLETFIEENLDDAE
jgi:hypothetical protein